MVASSLSEMTERLSIFSPWLDLTSPTRLQSSPPDPLDPPDPSNSPTSARISVVISQKLVSPLIQNETPALPRSPVTSLLTTSSHLRRILLSSKVFIDKYLAIEMGSPVALYCLTVTLIGIKIWA
ncbi:unnamed protein product [Arabis nemorensis]|uniref:Uncharacterized protein n=1 Tax=Arabis nemorensis TaxID=586526 RepID=A0A565CDI2_9BRAS|nr:unnamed protein product [Arabis nemorensis]